MDRNTIGLCEMIATATHFRPEDGAITIEQIEGFLKCSRESVYLARREGKRLGWLDWEHQPGIGDIYTFFPDKIESSPELTDRRTRSEQPMGANLTEKKGLAALGDESIASESVYPDTQLREGTPAEFVYPDTRIESRTAHPVSAAPGPAAPLCTADDKCPYKTNNVPPPGSLLRNVSTTKPIRTPDGQPALAGRKSVLWLALEKYLTDKFAPRFGKIPDTALLADLEGTLESRGASSNPPVQDPEILAAAFKRRVDDRDRQIHFHGYGLLADCARECAIGEWEPQEEDNNKASPEARRYAEKRAAAKRGQTNDSES